MDTLSSKLQNVSTVAIQGHMRPDGDCTGACLATYHYIKTYFPEIDVAVYLQEIPNIFKFLPGADQIRHGFDPGLLLDLSIVLDCGDLQRLGEFQDIFKQAKHTICIDHHVSNSGFADEDYVYPDASSTSELVFDLIEEERMTKEIAECIYTGIIHDTGIFQFSSTSSKTMGVAGKLMDIGLDFTKIIDETYHQKTYNQIRILGQVLLESKLYLGGACIVGTVSMDQMKEFDVLPKHLDGIVNQLRVTKGVEVAIFIYEAEKGFKVSLRSNHKVDVAAIALAFGGGGHVKAAGADVPGPLEEVIQHLLDEIGKQLG